GLWPPRSAGGGRGSGGHAHGVRPAGQRRALTVVLGISSAILAAEVAGAFLAGSLALLADAGHMLSDVAELGLALTAAGFVVAEAIRRLVQPPAVEPGVMAVFGVIALAGNAVSVLVLSRVRAGNLN